MTAAQSSLGGVVQTPEGQAEITGSADREIRVTIAGIECLALHDANGRTWVAVKPICEQLGIDPRNQQKRLQDPEEFDQQGVVLCTIPDRRGNNQSTLCLDVNHCVYWLGGISKKSCKPAARPKLRAVAAEIVSAIDVAINGPATAAAIAPQLSQAEMALIQMQTAVNAEKIAVANCQRVGALESKVALLETSLPEVADAFTLRGYLRVINYTITGTVEFRRSVRAMAGKALKKVAKEDGVELPSPVESPRDGFHLLYPRALLEAYAVTLVQDAENRKRSLSLRRARKTQADARARVTELEANDQACR